MEEDLLGGDSIENLQSYIYILELNIEMLKHYGKRITDIHLPLLGSIKKYENFVEKLLGIFRLLILSNGHLEEDNVLHQWDSYVARYFTIYVEFSVELMDRYTCFVTQYQQTARIIEKLEDKSKDAEEILKKFKFRIKYVADPPTKVVACFISNYKSYKKK